MERVAQQDQPGGCLVGGEEAGHPASERLATDHGRPVGWRGLPVGGDRPLRRPARQLDRLGREPALAQPIGPGPHRRGRPGRAVGESDGQRASHGA